MHGGRVLRPPEEEKMGELVAFPGKVFAHRASSAMIPDITLPGYGDSIPFDNDGRRGSLSDQWRHMCTRHGVDCGIRCVNRVPMLERSLTLEARASREKSAHIIFVRDLGQGRCVAVALPRIVLFESRNRRVLFFAKGNLDHERSIAALGRQLGDALHQS